MFVGMCGFVFLLSELSISCLVLVLGPASAGCVPFASSKLQGFVLSWTFTRIQLELLS